jgi:hypothetical protein
MLEPGFVFRQEVIKRLIIMGWSAGLYCMSQERFFVFREKLLK